MSGISEVFKVLSDETRLRIVRLFLHAEVSLCVCEIVDALNLPQYKVSRHLSALKNAGLMDAVKKGTWAYHRLKNDSPLLTKLWEYIGSTSLDEDGELLLERDREVLDWRLSLRDNDKCVVGLSFGTGKDEAGMLEGDEKRTKQNEEKR